MEINELIKDNIDFLKDYLPRLINAIEEGSNYLITNNEVEALKYTTAVIEGIEWIIRSVQSLQNFKYFEEINLFEVNSILGEISSAFEKKDFILLIDLFQYELLEKLIKWQTHLNKVLN